MSQIAARRSPKLPTHLERPFKITHSGNPGGFDDFTCEGRMDSTTGNTLTGSLRGSGFGGEPMKLERTQ